MKYILSIFLLIINFICSSNERPIFFTSVGKSGTNLLGKCISLLTDKRQMSNLYFNNKIWVENKGIFSPERLNFFKRKFFFHKHLPYSIQATEFVKKYDFIPFFMIRDPRDIIVSSYYWVLKHPNLLKDMPSLNKNDMITNLIHTRGCAHYVDWIKEPNVCTIRFENLIGQKGGGTEEQQIKEIKKIKNHLNIKKTDEEELDTAKILWGDNTRGTFRKGQIGSWKEYFTQEHKDLFKNLYGQLLIDLGYEKDMNW